MTFSRPTRLAIRSIRWARASDVIRQVNLRVRADNAGAIALYRSRGFAEEGVLRAEMRIHDEDHDQLWMGLSVVKETA